ncbi:class F sortase [Streptomyces sp. NPDC003036]|uniref:class F sortase n=1 Tax=Streptomyces sp. NPDC003036 TaxID=3154442 RepID=UPI0033AA79BC
MLLWPLALVVVVLSWAEPVSAPSVPAPVRQAAAPTQPPRASVGKQTPLSLPRSVPTRLRIPAIGVDAPFTDLSIGPSGRLEAPPDDDVNLVGWFAAGVSPGQLGTAIVAGHLDTKTSPAVFARLSTVQPGNRVAISRKDGTTATFVVDTIESFPQDDFPDERVYSDTADAQLRLITCGGSYDHEKKRYTENTVVFAHLDAVTQSARDGQGPRKGQSSPAAS